MTQRMSSSDACNLVSMSGIAMLTIVRSSRVMKNPSETTSNTAHGLPRNFFTVSPWRVPRPSGPPVTTGLPEDGGYFKIYLDLPTAPARGGALPALMVDGGTDS
jgi:hypothetical protein